MLHPGTLFELVVPQAPALFTLVPSPSAPVLSGAHASRDTWAEQTHRAILLPGLVARLSSNSSMSHRLLIF